MENYELLVPPNGKVIPFSEFTEEYAKEYFVWFISQIPIRLQQLSKYTNKNGMKNLRFDKTVDSLIPLWKWFESIIEIRKLSNEELERKLKGKPEWLQNKIKKQDWDFTTLSLAIGVDIGIYFGETFIKNNPTTKWGYFTKPKNKIFVNRPVILGFNKYDNVINTDGVVHTGMNEYIKNGDINKLLDSYNYYIKQIKNK